MNVPLEWPKISVSWHAEQIYLACCASVLVVEVVMWQIDKAFTSVRKQIPRFQKKSLRGSSPQSVCCYTSETLPDCQRSLCFQKSSTLLYFNCDIVSAKFLPQHLPGASISLSLESQYEGVHQNLINHVWRL